MRPIFGFDAISFYRDLLLCLPFREGDGSVTQDWAKPYHPMAFAGTPTWTNLSNDLTVIDFGNLDAITCAGASSSDLDFTSEDFTLACWAYHDDVSAAHVIMNRGVLNTCGWEFYTAVGNLALRTNQAGSREGASALSCVSTGAWQFFAVTRVGLVAQMYVDGEALYTLHTDDGILDPATCGAQTFYVGNNPHSNYFDGKLWNPRVWVRALAGHEVAEIFAVERHLFDV